MLPALWSLITSFRHEADIQRQLITLTPTTLTLDSYARILADGQVAQWFVNSIAVAGIRTVVQIALCSLAAFAFARIPFRGKRPLYLLVLIGIMVPFEAVLIPVYLLFAGAHLHNTWWALIAPDIASPLALFLLTQFFQEIPEGAGRSRIPRRRQSLHGLLADHPSPGHAHPFDAGHLHLPRDLEPVPAGRSYRPPIVTR